MNYPSNKAKLFSKNEQWKNFRLQKIKTNFLHQSYSLENGKINARILSFDGTLKVFTSV